LNVCFCAKAASQKKGLATFLNSERAQKGLHHGTGIGQEPIEQDYTCITRYERCLVQTTAASAGFKHCAAQKAAPRTEILSCGLPARSVFLQWPCRKTLQAKCLPLCVASDTSCHSPFAKAPDQSGRRQEGRFTSPTDSSPVQLSGLVLAEASRRADWPRQGQRSPWWQQPIFRSLLLVPC